MGLDVGGRHAPSIAEDLRVLLAFTPSFRLMIAHGYSDMVTPYAVSRYVLNHIPPNVARSAPSFGSIAAVTCSTSIRSRAKLHRRCTDVLRLCRDAAAMEMLRNALCAASARPCAPVEPHASPSLPHVQGHRD